MLENLKLGAIEGASALIVILALIISAVAILVIVIVNGMKLVKERRDALEDKAEDEFFAEYGITGEEMRLNQQLADMRDKLSNKRRFKKELLEEQRVIVVRETVAEQPAEDQPAVEEPVVDEVQEPAPQPVEEVVPEPAAEPVPEPVIEAAPQPEAIAPDEPIEEPKKAVAPKKAPKKKDDWSKYEGEFEGVYYDPEDACYYEGSAPPELAKKLAAKQKEFEAKAKKDKKEVIVKKIIPPFLALKTPKNPRQTPKKVDGFDEAVIYGKYVIEHVDKEDGTQEYFYTLYNPSGNSIYESSNYCELEYCKRAIVRFKSHVLIGEFTINAADLKFFFELKRKTYVHKGLPQDTYEAANALIAEVRNYAQTDIIREQ